MADYRHFTIEGFRNAEAFTARPAGGRPHKSPPRPDRKTHGDKLLADLTKAERVAKERLTQEPIRAGIQFIPMRFREGSAFDLEIKRLESERKGIRIVSAREIGNRKAYVVAVPGDQIEHLASKFRAYRDSDDKPKNEPLASSISDIDSANLEDYWTGADDDLPEENEVLWWEVWLDSRPGDEVDSWFRDTATSQQLVISRQEVRFPDRLVILARTSLSQWRRFPGLLKHLAEFRRANLVAGDFTRLTPASQAEFVDELLQRTTFAPTESVRICLLDTGINRGHPLLESAISADDAQAWRQAWQSSDHDGHGTLMAGVCLFGDLKEPLIASGSVELSHRLESVKILPPTGVNDPPNYGPITVGSMGMAEVNAPDSNRVFCLAVTAESDDHWRPTLWSAAIDQAAAGALDGYRRLLVISAGNLKDDVGKNYPDENHLSSVEDPSQCWNGLTVGGFTALAWNEELGLEGYSPVAKPGTLSPASRTSLCWGSEPWPYKPDVVFEGGNYAIAPNGFVTNPDDLAVLTTQSDPTSAALLGTICDTSAATAQAARMAAILQADYPNYWPETIRGLMVHSAEWTPGMLEEFP
ncbi:MAG: S8 family peptidase, partial [Pirellulaceae bacterium]